MGNSSLVTEDAKQWIVDETERLRLEIDAFGSNINAFGSNFQSQIDIFVAYENNAIIAFINSFNSQFLNFYTNGTNALNAHTGLKMMEAHGPPRVILSNYLDASKDLVSTRVLEIATTGGTLYAPCSTSQTGPQ